MTTDTRWIVGTAIALAGVIYWQIGGVNSRIDDLQTALADIRTDVRDIRADIRAVNERIDAVLLADRASSDQ